MEECRDRLVHRPQHYRNQATLGNLQSVLSVFFSLQQSHPHQTGLALAVNLEREIVATFLHNDDATK